eukprot:COSAG02_NODE_41357_length_395_cov_1.020270_1_plen_114_part_01
MATSLRRREETASTNLAGSAARIERCEAASQAVRQQPAVAPCVSSRQHVPKSTSCCSACTSSRSTSAPVLTAPEHELVAAAVVTSVAPRLGLVCLLSSVSWWSPDHEKRQTGKA